MSLLDSAYRRLFSHFTVLQDLLLQVCPALLLEHVDLDTAVPLSPVYVGPAMQNRQGDLAWKVPPRQKDKPALLVGIEHQSRSEPYMALRTGTYRHLQLEAFVKQHRPGPLLPTPLMLILYSGKQTWTAPIHRQDLFSDLGLPWLANHIPRQAYCLIDLKKHALDHSLPSNNLFGLICRIQHNQGLAHLSTLMQTVLDVCPDETLLTDIAAWVNQVILPRCLPDLDLPHHLHLKDIRAMLEDHSDSWLHQWEAQGIEKGLQKGRREGLQKGVQRGLQSALLNLLQYKFGAIQDPHKQYVNQASPEQLTIWSLAVLDAKSVDEVFSAPAQTSTHSN